MFEKKRRRIRRLNRDETKARNRKVPPPPSAPRIIKRVVTSVYYTYQQLLDLHQGDAHLSRILDKARERMQEWVMHDAWNESLIEECTTGLESIGFNGAEIAWSGFSSQGDGASFTSDSVDLDQLIRFMCCQCEAKNFIGPTDRTNNEKDDYWHFMKLLAGKAGTTDKNYMRLLPALDIMSAKVTRGDSRYAHEHTCDFEADIDIPLFDRTGSGGTSLSLKYRRISELFRSFTAEAEELREALSNGIYKQLNDLYNAMHEDEFLSDEAANNEILFNQRGKIVREEELEEDDGDD
jgi:hypothetical protein